LHNYVLYYKKISIYPLFLNIIQKFQIFIKRLAAVDNTLEKLGISKTYHKLYTYVKRVLIGWLVFVNLVNIIDMMCIWWSDIEDHRYLILPYILNYHFHVNMFMDLLLATLLWSVLFPNNVFYDVFNQDKQNN